MASGAQVCVLFIALHYSTNTTPTITIIMIIIILIMDYTVVGQQ